MGRSEQAVYQPNPDNVAAYDEMFADYTTLHDYFGRGGNDVMHRLKARRRKAAAAGGAGSGSVDSHEPEVEAAARSSA
jgi:L-ribulokinase